MYDFISMLSPLPNRPRKKNGQFTGKSKEKRQRSQSRQPVCRSALHPNTKPKCYILDHGVLYTKLYHFTDMAKRYTGRSRVAETRKLNSGQGCEWNETVTNDSSKNSEVRAQQVLLADNGLQRLTEHNYDQHRYNKDPSLGHMRR